MAEKKYIELNEAVKACEDYFKDVCVYDVDSYEAVNDFERILDSIPAADAVEVVRCKDCKHYQNSPNGLCYLHTEPCDNAKGYKGVAVCVEDNSFCSYGEREDNNGKK